MKTSRSSRTVWGATVAGYARILGDAHVFAVSGRPTINGNARIRLDATVAINVGNDMDVYNGEHMPVSLDSKCMSARA